MITEFAWICTIIALAISAAVVFIPWARISGNVAKGDRFNRWLPIYAAIGALILFLPTMIYGGDNDVLYILIIAPIISLIFLFVALFYAIRKKKQSSLAVLAMLVVYVAVSWGLWKNSFELHSTTQWLFWSKGYKARVLSQPTPAAGELRHIEWDVWGFAGLETVTYLVFDPSDLLATAAKSHSPGKFSGIPCEVDRVWRLESHYYAVVFYTDTGWDSCNY